MWAGCDEEVYEAGVECPDPGLSRDILFIIVGVEVDMMAEVPDGEVNM